MALLQGTVKGVDGASSDKGHGGYTTSGGQAGVCGVKTQDWSMPCQEGSVLHQGTCGSGGTEEVKSLTCANVCSEGSQMVSFSGQGPCLRLQCLARFRSAGKLGGRGGGRRDL